jgi:putative Mg2+ transporter-C (MgtC) family protein
MLVSLGTALFVVAPAEAGIGEGDTGRILQGIAAGIGFIGAGTILKRADREEIQGLTTAASI